MKYVMLAIAAALAVGTAHAENQRPSNSAARPHYLGITSESADKTYSGAESSVVASLNALLADWDRAGFVAPSKPGQYRLYGRNGYVTNGACYNAMVSLIRSAVSDTQQGRDHDALTKIAKARRLLAAGNLGQGQ
jgi:hypothetical protein